MTDMSFSSLFKQLRTFKSFTLVFSTLFAALSVILFVVLSVAPMSFNLFWCWLCTVSTFTYFVRAVLRPLILIASVMTVNNCRVQQGHFERHCSEQKTVKTTEVIEVLQKEIEDDILFWVFSESLKNKTEEEKKKKKYECLWLICCIRLFLVLSSVWIFLTCCLTVFFFFFESWLWLLTTVIQSSIAFIKVLFWSLFSVSSILKWTNLSSISLLTYHFRLT